MNSDAPAASPWFNPVLIVSPSAIEGMGLFATEDIPDDTPLVRLGGHLVDSDELGRLIATAKSTGRYVDTITVDEDAHLVLPPHTPVHFGNHSCDPSAWHCGPYEVRARGAMRAGEEMTIDYGTNSGASGFQMRCSCGSTFCRGVVTSEDWRRPELQARYAGHWVPALAARILRAVTDDGDGSADSVGAQ